MTILILIIAQNQIQKFTTNTYEIKSKERKKTERSEIDLEKCLVDQRIYKVGLGTAEEAVDYEW